MIDLHTHTSASDGTLEFGELVLEAKRVGLNAIAITDHDSVDSAMKITGREPVKTIPGIEITVFDSEFDYEDIHVLGLFINPKNILLSKTLKKLEKEREDQKKATIVKLQELGYEITFDQVRKKAAGSIGRPHIAKTLIEKYPQEFRSIGEVFDKLLDRHGKAYVERKTFFGFRAAISLIKNSGGLSFIAHPGHYPYDKKLIADFKAVGGDGIEVYYNYHLNQKKISENESTRLIENYHSISCEFDLLESGGSDFHGANKGHALGEFSVPDELLISLKKQLRKPL